MLGPPDAAASSIRLVDLAALQEPRDTTAPGPGDANVGAAAAAQQAERRLAKVVHDILTRLA